MKADAVFEGGGVKGIGLVGAVAAVIVVIAAIIFLGQYSAAVSVGLPDLELAFIAGFGADKIVKNAMGI